MNYQDFINKNKMNNKLDQENDKKEVLNDFRNKIVDPGLYNNSELVIIRLKPGGSKYCNELLNIAIKEFKYPTTTKSICYFVSDDGVRSNGGAYYVRDDDSRPEIALYQPSLSLWDKFKLKKYELFGLNFD